GKLTLYLLTVLKMNKKFLTPLLFFGRIWDGVNDLIMGTLIDSTRGRFGKFRPWIALGAFTNALVTVALFGRPAALAAHPLQSMCYIALFYLLWDLTYTMADVSYYAMIPALSSSPRERDQLSMLPRIFSGAVGIATAFIMTLIDRFGGAAPGVAATAPQRTVGFFRYALLTSGIYILTSLYSAALVKEPGIRRRAAAGGELKSRVTLRKAVSILLGNRQALVIAGVMLLFNLACNLTNGVAQYYFLFVVKNTTQLGFFGTLLGAAQAVGLFAFPVLSRLLGRPRVYTASLLLPCAGYALMAAANLLRPGEFLPLAASAFAAFIGYGSMSVMQSVMLADAVDYGEYQTGERNEGVVFSMLTMLSKLAGAFCELITMLVFFVVRFGGEDATEATSAAVKGISFLMYVLPPVALLCALLFYKRGFKLSPAFMAQVNGELEQRRKARQGD
ncbi:MAG: glycoside-pentoside-hexuronide (GPH):cation symporter, partial [Oscillospiraceae bacterium]|nr:glycoside-pentoside-hexuronide (GPH):cation symporter [Oscillospiraceae bacterium]